MFLYPREQRLMPLGINLSKYKMTIAILNDFFFVIQIKNYDTFFLGDTENETPSRTFYNAPNIL